MAKTIAEKVVEVMVMDVGIRVTLMDGRSFSVPLAWFPRLLQASKEQRRNWQLIGRGIGIHWPDVDEDISVEGLLRGATAPRRPVKA